MTQRLHRLLAHPRAPLVVLGLLVLATTVWTAWFGLDNHDRQNDEYLSVLGSRQIAADPIKGIFATSYGDRGPERLTGILLWIAQAWPGPTAADFQAGRVLIALCGALVAVPTYLLARGVGLGRWLAVATGAVAVVTPWAVFGETFLNTVPGLLMCTLLFHAMWRSTVRPSIGADAWVLATALLATAARVSSIAFVLALALAIPVTAWRDRPADVDRRTWLRRLPLVVARQHPLLAGVGLLGALALAVRGQAGVIGGYGSQITDQSIELGRLGDQAFEVLGRLAPTVAVIIAVFGVVWLAREVVHPRGRETGAFAVVALGVFVAYSYVFYTATLEDRYVTPLLPLLVVAAARPLATGEVGWVGAAIGGAVVARAVAVGGPQTNEFPYAAFIDAGSIFLKRVVEGRVSNVVGGGSLTVLLLALAALAVGLALLVARRPARRAVVAGVVLALVTVHGAVAGTYAMNRYTDLAGRPGTSFAALSFADEEVGVDGPVAVFGSPVGGGDVRQRLLEVNYFNRSARATLLLDDVEQRNFCCAPNPTGNTAVVADERTGAVRVVRQEGAPLPRWYVAPTGFARLAFDGVWRAQSPSAAALVERDPRRPLQLAYAFLDGTFEDDGWSRGAEPMRLRAFPASVGGTSRRCVQMIVTAPPLIDDAPPTTRWSVGARSGERRTGELQPGERADVRVALPEGDAPVLVSAGATPSRAIGGEREAALRLDDVRVVGC
ncbi:hypothetical protein [Conexibacter sp. SYSU D00693]|uniref:hypothetical protein n=1 Tax=Conexibacter sp. SYSU D00693 TaxID=2812560 RepID=UPI00196B066D|nr:hypothetical protein [Conexibacter sp. SYSU D00693]